MTSTMHYWNQLDKPPASALKTIGGGRLKGMTDINPQWRLEAMTEVFGPCGIGWKYTIDRLWTEPGNGEEILAFAQVSVFIKDGEEWSAPIPGIGGNKLVTVERGGIHNNDEGYKMAVTDALSVALKALGVGAEVYAGRWDGSKYHLRPEDVVTLEQLNNLKVKFHKSNESSLKGLDKKQIGERFNKWCLELIGEHVDYRNERSWTKEWYDKAWQALTGVSAEVPFEE